MKILLAGATGAIGRPLVPRLVEAGHEVLGLTRRAEKTRQIEQAGATAAVCDVKERAALLKLAEEFDPDVVVDETTDLPQRYDSRTMKGFYDAMTELRLRGTPNLMDAANATNARIVFQSVGFLYAPGDGARPRTETDPALGVDAPPPWDVALPAIVALEQRAVDSGGIVLRYGMFYGPHTHADRGGEQYESVMKRRFPLVGGAHGRFSFIHVHDAADATVRAIEHGRPGIYNVVDDEPLTLSEWLPLYAKAIGAPKPLRVPLWLAKMVSAPLPLYFATRMPPASNAKAKAELGWTPAHPTVREGFRAGAAAREDGATRGGASRVAAPTTAAGQSPSSRA